MKNKPKWIKTADFLVVVYEGQSPRTFNLGTDIGDKVLSLLSSKKFKKARNLVFPEEIIKEASKGLYRMEEYGNVVIAEGGDTDPLIDHYLKWYPVEHSFYKALFSLGERVKKIESDHVRNQLVGFLKSGKMPITEDGCFIAYKYVHELQDGSLVDCHTKTIPNNVGDSPSMALEDVETDPKVVCAPGLHVASWEYASNRGGTVLIACRVKPEDVVSVPNDHSHQKLRCTKYTVLARGLSKPIPELSVGWEWDSKPTKKDPAPEKDSSESSSTSRRASNLLFPINFNKLTDRSLMGVLESSIGLAFPNPPSRPSLLKRAIRAFQESGLRVKGDFVYLAPDQVSLNLLSFHDLRKMSGSEIKEYIKALTGVAITVSSKSKANIIRHAKVILEERKVPYAL